VSTDNHLGKIPNRSELTQTELDRLIQENESLKQSNKVCKKKLNKLDKSK
jgi:hypothetical protein